MTKLAAIVLVASAAAACATTRPAVPASAPLVIPPLGSAPHKEAPRTGERNASGCLVRLAAGRIEKSSGGCFLDEKISHGPGTLVYPCSGDGPAEATFGEHRYTGRIEGGELELELQTELDWDDGCRWGTHAQIRGVLTNRGELTLKRLSWTYRDRVVSGSACSGQCTAKASFDVTSTKAVAEPKGAARGDDDDDSD